MVYIDLDCTLIDSAKRSQDEMKVAARYGIGDTLYLKAIDLALERHGISNFGYDVFFEACKIIKPDLDGRILSDLQRV